MNQRSGRRLLALLLVLVMLLAGTVFAEDPAGEDAHEHSPMEVSQQNAADAAEGEATPDPNASVTPEATAETPAPDASATTDPTAIPTSEVTATPTPEATAETPAPDASATADASPTVTAVPTATPEPTATPCPHTNSYTWIGMDNMRLVNVTAYGHTYMADRVEEVYCEDCDYEKNTVLEKDVLVTKNHSLSLGLDWKSGQCEYCGYLSQCQHEHTHVEYVDYDDASKFSNITNTTHEFSESFIIGYRCVDCHAGVEKEQTDTLVMPHEFDGGDTCVCGYTRSCTDDYHKSIATSSQAMLIGKDECCQYFDINSDTHTRSGYTLWSYKCDQCGENGSWIDTSESGTYTLTEAHTLDDHGQCIYCGYESTPCAHTNRTRYRPLQYDYDNEVYTDSTNTTHTVSGIVSYVWEYCVDCNAAIKVIINENVSQEQHHRYHNGKCIDCGHVSTCEHKNGTISEVEIETEWLEYKNITSSTHDVKYWEVTTDYCKDCGEQMECRFTDSTWGTFDHSYINGICDCGAVCQHEYANGYCIHCNCKQPEPTATPTPEPMVTPTVAPTATPTAEPTATPTVEPTATPTMPAVSDEPTMPTVTDNTAPTGKPAPEFVDVPADESVNGVKAEDGRQLVETMVTVAEALEAEGENVTVEIVNLDKLITAEEKAALNELTMREQLLTFLSVIGFEEQVNAALESQQQSLSDGATALKAQILDRLSAMDEAERAQFEAMLLENFAQENIVIDGVEYSFFVLEIEVSRGDELRIERYGFRREGEEWIFTRLEIAE